MALFWALSFTIFLALLSLSVNGDDGKSFIIRVQNNLRPSQFSDVEEWYSSILHSLNVLSPKSETTTNDNIDNLIHVYKTVFHGFSAKLTKKQAKILETRPEILGLIPDKVLKIQTTRTPLFLGLPYPKLTKLTGLSDYGSNVTIGMLDTGVWPERRSFRDDGLDPIPAHWKGECVEGENFTKSNCNKKLIGAKYFLDGAEDEGIIQSSDIRSARDNIGHGTHTASTAAGMPVSNASFLETYANGVAVGIAPKSRIAVYKVCWGDSCAESDILAGFDSAVEDGVDVISLSIGGPATPYDMDAIAIASFAAMERGVFVSAAAGNSGPFNMSLSNIAPWITTVGAGSIDRRFPADLVLEGGRKGRIITGSSLYKGDPLSKSFLPLIYGGNASLFRRDHNNVTLPAERGHPSTMCLPDTLDPKLVRGKIVVCDSGYITRVITRVAKGLVVKEAGGVGIVINSKGEGEAMIADPHLIPGLAISESGGDTVMAYLNSTSNPRATIVFRGTQVDVQPAPVLAYFSSRGPNPLSDYVLKPDLFAPGLNILAAWPDGVPPSDLPEDPRRTEFNIISGTSMSCPHVSGIAALMKGAHPNWSPAMIRSALVTTAYASYRNGETLLDGTYNTAATAWDMGAGHVDPEKAVDPGLVYDLTTDDYVNFLCASNYSSQSIQMITRRPSDCKTPSKPWDLNLPSIVMTFDVSKLEAVVTRTVTHVSSGASSYIVSVINPKNAILTVVPPKMEFKAMGEKQSYRVKIIAQNRTSPSDMSISGHKPSEFGKVVWSDGRHQVTSPVVVT